MITSPGFLTRKDLYRISIIFFKFKHENVIKMKNKPDPALLQPSNLSNEIKKRVPKSRTFKTAFYVTFGLTSLLTRLAHMTVGQILR
jgi:hypothetical protein